MRFCDEIAKMYRYASPFHVIFGLTCDLTSGTFIWPSSMGTLVLPLMSQRPAPCWGKKQCTKWIFVRLSCSQRPSTWNLTCKATEFLLMPAWPLVKVRRIDDILRKWCEPSRPATEPDMEVMGPRLVRKRSETLDLFDSWRRIPADLEAASSLEACNHPSALYCK